MCPLPTPVWGVGDASPPWGEAPVVDLGLTARAWGCVVVPTPVRGVGDAPPPQGGTPVHAVPICFRTYGPFLPAAARLATAASARATAAIRVGETMGRSYPRLRGRPLLLPPALPPLVHACGMSPGWEGQSCGVA